MFRNLVQAIGVLMISLLVVVCNPMSAPDPVSLQLSWYHEAEFVGYYMAEAQGFYADENITVDIREGGQGVDAPQLLLSRQVDRAIFGVANQQQAMQEGQSVVAVGASFQMTPQVLFALATSDIHKPQDLVGRRVAVKSASWRQVIHETLINAGIDPAEIVEVEVEYDAMEMLYAGAVDVWTGYVHG